VDDGLMAEVLGRRALNRAFLARQLLLERAEMAPLEAVEHLVGLQAQAPFPPYYGLWSRLAAFAPDELGNLLLGRQVVRIVVMRRTIHLVSARDALPLGGLLQPVLDRGFFSHRTYGPAVEGVDLAELATAARAILDDSALTAREL